MTAMRRVRRCGALAVALIALLCVTVSSAIGSAAAAAPSSPSPSPSPSPSAAIDSMAQRAKACTGCHGLQGRSSPEGYVPRLAGKPAGYLLEQLRAFREGRRAHETMARMLETLDAPMLEALAEHFAAMQVPYPAPVIAPPVGDEARVARTLIHTGDPQRGLPSCSSCHGQALTGIAPSVPGLLGLPRDYLVSQIGGWRNGVRRARRPDCMAEVAHKLSIDEIAAVSRWLAAQPVHQPSGSLVEDVRPGAAKTAATASAATWPMDCGSINQ